MGYSTTSAPKDLVSRFRVVAGKQREGLMAVVDFESGEGRNAVLKML